MPRFLTWIVGIIGILQLFALIKTLDPIDLTDRMVVRFDQVSRCDETVSSNSLSDDGIAAIIDQPTDIQNNCWHSVKLPELNPAQDVSVDFKKPQLRRIWYRLHIMLPENWDGTKPLMVYSPRIAAQAWQIKMGGQFADNRHDWRMTWNRPMAATFPALPVSQNQALEIDVGVIASNAEGFSISRFFVGDATAIILQKKNREFLQVLVPQAVSTVLFFLGLFFLSFWLVRRAETEYLYLFFCSLAYSLINIGFTEIQPDDPKLYNLYNVMI